MDETTLDPEYLKQLKPSFLHLFINFVKICNVISLFHKYNINVLTEIDVENIKTLSDNKGDREGSMLLLERLFLYRGWYDCLLQVLRDRDVRLSHVAHEMEVIKGLLDEKILSEESDDQTQTTVQWLAGLSVLTSGLTTVLRVTPHTKNLNNLKVDPILEMRSLKLKIELERLKKELEEVKQNLMERNQSFEQQHLEANSVLSSDSSDVDQLAGKMCELCKSSKEMLKQNEILQTELNHLREAYTDSKAFCEKLNQEKEVLQTELDHLKKNFSDRNDSYENLQQEKEKLQIELDQLTQDFSDRDNVLMQDERHADFGISKILQDVSSTSTSGVGTTRWMAPEIMDVECHNLKHNEKADIWKMASDIMPVLLLVGRTGSGKSSVGNTLLGEARFPVTRGDSPDNHLVRWAKNGNIKVVDGSRIGDTGEDMPGGVEDSIRRAEEAFSLCGGGFNALVFCLRYGDMFTNKEKDAVQLVKALFGDGVFRRCGVVILTYGDNFEFDVEGEVTFNEWVNRQLGDFRALVNECGGRCFLLNNRNKDKEQGMDIIAVASRLQRYTEAEFNAAIESRQLLVKPPPVQPSQNIGKIRVHKIFKSKQKALIILGSQQQYITSTLENASTKAPTVVTRHEGKNVKKITVDRTHYKIIDYTFNGQDSLARSYLETGHRFTAILLCVTAGRITEEENNMVREVKELFGDRSLRERGILVVKQQEVGENAEEVDENAEFEEFSTQFREVVNINRQYNINNLLDLVLSLPKCYSKDVDVGHRRT